MKDLSILELLLGAVAIVMSGVLLSLLLTMLIEYLKNIGRDK